MLPDLLVLRLDADAEWDSDVEEGWVSGAEEVSE